MAWAAARPMGAAACRAVLLAAFLLAPASGGLPVSGAAPPATLCEAVVEQLPRPLEQVARPPIRIAGDQDLTPANGVVAGLGEPWCPYVIAFWRINATFWASAPAPVVGPLLAELWAGPAVRIEGTTKPLVVAHNLLVDSAAGVALVGARNVAMRNNTVASGLEASEGVVVEASREVLVQGNVLGVRGAAVRVTDSAGVEVAENRVAGAAVGLRSDGSEVVFLRNVASAQRGAWVSGGSVRLEANSLQAGECALVAEAAGLMASGNTLGPAPCGARLEGLEGGSLEGNTLADVGTAVVVSASRGAAVEGNSVLRAREGVRVEGGSRVRVAGNTFEAVAEGPAARVLGGEGHAVERNLVERVRGGGIVLEGGSGHSARENTLREAYPFAVRVLNSTSNDVSRNTVEGLPTLNASSRQLAPSLGIRVEGGGRHWVAGNLVTRTLGGILVARSDDNLVADNRLTLLLSFGLGLVDASRALVVRNNVSVNHDGISMVRGTGNLLAENVANGNTMTGFILSTSSLGNTLERNIVSGNHWGIVVQDRSDRNLIRNNTIARNNLTGLDLRADSAGNLAEGNDIRSTANIGVLLYRGARDNVLRGNHVTGSGFAGAASVCAGANDARGQWWGAPDGPAPNGTGDRVWVREGSLAIEPWLPGPLAALGPTGWLTGYAPLPELLGTAHESLASIVDAVC